MNVFAIIIIVAASVSAAEGSAMSQAGRLDVLPDPPILSSCNVGRVVGLRPGRHLLVRSESLPNGPIIDRLDRGEYVLVCNEGRDEQYRHYSGVVYSRPGDACRTGLPRKPVSFNRSCRWGWVRQQWVELLTG